MPVGSLRTRADTSICGVLGGSCTFVSVEKKERVAIDAGRFWTVDGTEIATAALSRLEKFKLIWRLSPGNP